MATAKKLPSGNWNITVYDYTDDNGKRHYQSFTSLDGSKQEKKRIEAECAAFVRDKKSKKRPGNLTLKEGIERYINSKDAVLSPKTIAEYRKILKNAFQTIMDLQISELTEEIIQEAVNKETKRNSGKSTKNPHTISPKTVKNEFGLIATVISKHNKNIDLSEVDLPKKIIKIKELIEPEIIFEIVHNTPIELPVMLAMWLSFSMSEIRGLKRSSVTPDGYILINQVIVDVDNKPVEKQQAKVFTRIRKHKIPAYIMQLINKIPEDQEYLVTLSGRAITGRFTNLLKKNNLPHMTFHDLRHINASVMALLRVPDQYAMERGGWKTDSTMKKVYTHTFSDQREAVDNAIDKFFESKIKDKMQNGMQNV